SAESLAQMIVSLWPESQGEKIFVVCTGGEPALQMDDVLVECFHRNNIEIAIETNGTVTLPDHIDWVCVSPKANTEIIVRKGNELKLVFPQKENKPEDFTHLDFEHFYIQPLDDENQTGHIYACVQYCKSRPQWKLSLQTHKIIGIE